MNSVAEIDQGIFQTLVDLRGSSAQNDFSALEDRVLEIKGSVLRREYSYGAELTEEDLTNRLQRAHGRVQPPSRARPTTP